MPTFRRQAGAAAVLILGLALTACGSGDADPGEQASADPVAWVGAFCGGIGEVLAGASALQGQHPDPQSQKEALVNFADSAAKAMSGAAGKLKELGPPSVPNGQQVHDTAVGFFTNSGATISGQQAQLEALDPNAPDFAQQLSRIQGPDLQSAAEQAQSLTSNPDLTPAFKSAPECQQLGGGGGTAGP